MSMQMQHTNAAETVAQAILLIKKAASGLEHGWDQHHHQEVRDLLGKAYTLMAPLSHEPVPSPLPQPDLYPFMPFRFRRACSRKLKEVLETLSIEEVRGNPVLISMCMESVAEAYQLMC